MSKPDETGAAPLDPNKFCATLAEFVTAEVRRESATGASRNIRARFEAMGVHKGGLALFLRLRKLEPEDAELTLVTALRLARWTNLPIGAQSNLFAHSDDAGLPSAKAAEQLSEAQIYQEGYSAGINGRDATDNRFAVGSPMAQKFYDAWVDGQTELALQMGVDRPAEGKTLKRERATKPTKTKPGVETRSAKPSGGARRGRGGQRGARGIDKLRENRAGAD